ncbi:hypothetical protein NPIL_554401 [Nephila pilipes]|uniref:Uncharacterized protein n=1 Tax=Nephila pilipes TaxID=299642 RepID=A0A8X6PYY7_NEPPI|nr:hypothetical protein NPIL_554401 [Nephila pilipes]
MHNLAAQNPLKKQEIKAKDRMGGCIILMEMPSGHCPNAMPKVFHRVMKMTHKFFVEFFENCARRYFPASNHATIVKEDRQYVYDIPVDLP